MGQIKEFILRGTHRSIVIIVFISGLLLLSLIHLWSKPFGSASPIPSQSPFTQKIRRLQVEKRAPTVASQHRDTTIAIRVTQGPEDKQRYVKKFFIVNERRDVIGELDLNDNGKGNDLYKHDGIFTGSYTFENEGQYWVKTIFLSESKEIVSMIDPHPIQVLPFIIINSGVSLISPNTEKTLIFTILNTSERTIRVLTEITIDQRLKGDRTTAKKVVVAAGSEVDINVPVSLQLVEVPKCLEEDYFVDMKATLMNPLTPSSSRSLSSQIDIFTPRC